MSGELSFWRAVGLLRVERPAGLVGMEECFAAGSVPTDVGGIHRGRMLATTCGWPVDGLVEGLARVWMPWWGVELARDGASGVHLLTAGGGRLLGVLARGVEQVVRTDRRVAVAPFTASVTASALDPSVSVLRVDDPGVEWAWIELVQAADGILLAQKMLDWRGRVRRTAWFSLEI